MPAPYPQIKMPSGDINDIFDFQALNMAAAHNTILRGINAIAKHAPNVRGEKIQPFLVFALTVVSTLHRHHEVEETYTFPKWEEKLGKGALSDSLHQHELFVPQVAQLEQYLREAQAGMHEFDGKRIVDTIESFGDIMVQHLNDEIATLDSSRMRAAFTAQELKDIDKGLMKHVLAAIDYYSDLPLIMVCRDPDVPWFPPLPLPVKLATQWWLYRKHNVIRPQDYSIPLYSLYSVR